MSFQVDIDNWQQAIEYLIDNTKRPHIDREMMSCELSLNLYGISTWSSCCCKFPYVIIGSVTPEQFEDTGQNLLQLLDSFYRVRNRQGSYGKRLTIQSYGIAGFALVNQGSLIGLCHNSYLQEFVDFTTFLTDYLDNTKGANSHV